MSWASHIRGAISQLLDDDYWIATQSEAAIQEIENLWFLLSEVGQAPMSVPTGVIVAYPDTTTPPIGWLKCDGNTYDNADYPELAAIMVALGFGGATQFEVPNLNSRIPVGWNPVTVPISGTGDINTTADFTGIGYYGMVWWIKAG